MPTIVVSNQLYTYVANNAEAMLPLEKPGEQRPNGDWEMFISDDYVQRMKPHMLLHESVGEALERMYQRMVMARGAVT